MASRTIQLRWHGRCCLCRVELGARETAAFDDVTRELTCMACIDDARDEARSVQPPAAPQPVRPRHYRPPVTDRAQVKALIADARAALESVHDTG
jgi:hypothetical protein